MSFAVSFLRYRAQLYTMPNSYDVNSSGDATITTVPHQRMQEIETNKPTENTSLSPNSNQTYFADERVQVPETTNVSWYFISCQMKNEKLTNEKFIIESIPLPDIFYYRYLEANSISCNLAFFCRQDLALGNYGPSPVLVS